LHVGSAWTALASWVFARRAGGKVTLRIEDLDGARVVPGARERIEEDLLWLGLDWDEGPVLQSERGTLYDDAIANLAGRGFVYPCDCSRAEIARVASAPHEGEETIYPGTCRDRDPHRSMKRPPASRLRAPDETIAYDDEVLGPIKQNLLREVGDFVLKRGDGVPAYQLAVVVDDAAARITHVIRGADLVASTPRQIWLALALGATPPRYGHVPLVITQAGGRLEKRTAGVTIRSLRAGGMSAAAVVGALAHGLGLAPTDEPASADVVAQASARSTSLAWRQDAWHVPWPRTGAQRSRYGA
jgi:glutamyl-tRNA synthetase